MKLFFRTLFALFAAVSLTVFAADGAPESDSMSAQKKEFDKDDITSVREFAEQGNPEAQYYLGLHYEKEKDMAEAVKWYRKAAVQEDLDAQYKLGLCYENGDGVDQNSEEAVKWYQKAAEHGIVEAQYKLGICYENGIGIEKDIAEAVKWYQMVADRKNIEAQYRLGYCYGNYSEVRNSDKAAIWYRRAAERGHAEAQYDLGTCYETGKGVEKSIKEAVYWYAKAADQGILNAQLKLGMYYESGAEGVPKNMAVAAKWYWKAVENGYRDPNLLYRYGGIFEDGVGLEIDMKEAIKWYLKAAEQGYGNAQFYYKFGKHFENGNGVRLDWGKAIKWYKKAADLNLLDAIFRVGYCYENDGIAKDREAAVEWYRKAAEQGSADAQYALGVCYEKGRGVEKDESKAVEWYRKAAEQDSADAQYALGVCYEKGRGAVKNKNIAEKWYKDAAKRGHAKAKVKVGALSEIRIGMSNGLATISFPKGIKLMMTKVEAGSFLMGRENGENNRAEDQHFARLTKDFYIGQTEVTQGQWTAVMGTNPSKFQDINMPVENVSWNDAMEFCEMLNAMRVPPKGWKFTLPTETQWEYAACGGKWNKNYKYSGSNTPGEVAWTQDESRSRTQIVGGKNANGLGLYDMSGNVWEWCLDDWNEKSSRQKAEFTRGNDRNGPNRVRRGGSCFCGANACRTVYRGESVHPGTRNADLGFRLALVPDL